MNKCCGVCTFRIGVRGGAMRGKPVVHQKASVAELILILRKTQKEIAAHGELNESNLLLYDFVKELLKRHLLRKA